MRNKILYRRKALILIQKSIRGHLAKKQHQPRYKGIIKIKSLKTQIKKLEQVANELKKDKETNLKDIRSIESAMLSAISTIKNDSKIKTQQIEKLYNDLLNRSNNQMLILQKKMQEQRNDEEQARLRKIQEEMEKERKEKEEEERKRRDEEEIRKQ